MEGTVQAPTLSHEERLERHYHRIRGVERRRAGKPAKIRTAPNRKRPICCSVFPFAASLTMAGTVAPLKVPVEVRFERWNSQQTQTA